jgi:hypothetical protein
MADKKPFGQTFGGQMLSGLGGSLANGLFNIGAAKRQFKYQSKLQQQQYDLNEKAADAAYERQKDFFNIQNEWNDPSAVRERYENANINPTSAFGAAGSYTPAQQAATAPQGSGAGLGAASAFPITDPIEQAYRLAMIRNVDADTKKKEGETLDPSETKRAQQLENQLRELKIVGQDVLNQQSQFNLEFDQATRELNIEKLKQSVDNMKQQYENMSAEYIRILNGTQLDMAQADVLRDQLRLNAAHIALMEAQEKAARAGAALDYKRMQEIDSSMATANTMRDYLRNKTTAIANDTKRTEVLREIDEFTRDTQGKQFHREHLERWSRICKNYLDAIVGNLTKLK